jgi:bifunctional DNA-binding transcriptional regulator/antitoxin component of YhaV-PrlF toxin-antitoxin module
MPKPIHFTAELMDAGGGGTYVLFPYSTEEKFGIKGRVPVKATIDGEPYRGSLIKYGNPLHMLLVRKDIREKTGKKAGDMIDVTIEQDSEKREIEIPEDLTKALKANKLETIFLKMSYSHQREYMLWIESAKKAETRENRIVKSIEKLLEKNSK